MSGSPASLTQRRTMTFPAWLPAAAMLLAFALFGPGLGCISRPMFVIACAALGWHAWSRGPGQHLQSALFLFAFAPFVRRLVDLSVGYDDTGIMLIGPMAAILVPAIELRALLKDNHPFWNRMAPLIIVGACVGYAIALTLFQGEWTKAASATIKWYAPLLYAAVLIDCNKRDEIVNAAVGGFMVILPVMGLYGIFQFV